MIKRCKLKLKKLLKIYKQKPNPIINGTFCNNILNKNSALKYRA